MRFAVEMEDNKHNEICSVEGSPTLYKATRMKKMKEKEGKSYDGSTYRVSFRSDRDIKLAGFGFFGPSEELSASDYTVKLHVTLRMKDYSKKSRFNCIGGPRIYEYEVAQYAVQILQVPAAKIFHVILPRQIRLSSGHWVDVKFELKGKDTSFMQEMWEESKVCLKEGTFVNFEFLPGSCQLPEILFSV